MESSCGLITSKLNEKFRVGNRGVECRISFVERFAGAFVLSFLGSTYKGRTYGNHLSSIT
ncbi:MAG: hypothetical protein WAL24_02805 [Nitrososphaeraceae archaeon]